MIDSWFGKFEPPDRSKERASTLENIEMDSAHSPPWGARKLIVVLKHFPYAELGHRDTDADFIDDMPSVALETQ
jgi:hypothetical protein